MNEVTPNANHIIIAVSAQFVNFCCIGPSHCRCCFLLHSSDAEKGKGSILRTIELSFFGQKYIRVESFPNLDRPWNKNGPKRFFCCCRFNKKLILCRLNGNKNRLKWILMSLLSTGPSFSNERFGQKKPFPVLELVFKFLHWKLYWSWDRPTARS